LDDLARETEALTREAETLTKDDDPRD